MRVRFSSRSSVSRRFRLPDFGERKPSKTKLCSGNPAIGGCCDASGGTGNRYDRDTRFDALDQ